MFEKFFKKISDFAKKIDDQIADTITQQCPACGGQMEGLTNQKTLNCPYCGSSCINENFIEARDRYINPHPFGEDEDDEGYNEEITDENMDHLNVVTSDEAGVVYAYIEKSGLFYNGEIPGLAFSRVNLCDSYMECLNQLVENFREEREKTYYEAPRQDLNEIQRKHPKAKIIKLS